MIDVTVKLSGGLFAKNIPRVVEDAIVAETMNRISERMRRKGIHGSGGQGKGVQRNIVGLSGDGLQLELSTTLRWPRKTGRAFRDKNARIVKSMAPRVARKTAERIAQEMGRA